MPIDMIRRVRDIELIGILLSSQVTRRSRNLLVTFALLTVYPIFNTTMNRSPVSTLLSLFGTICHWLTTSPFSTDFLNVVSPLRVPPAPLKTHATEGRRARLCMQ